MQAYAVSDASLHTSMRGWEIKGTCTHMHEEKGSIWGLAGCDVVAVWRSDAIGLWKGRELG
jgi:hypothetical protein